MPDAVLRLRVDPVTGKRTLSIDYASESDALPIEHEEEHRKLAEKVMEGGLRSDKVTVSREQEKGPAADAKEPARPVAQPVPTKR